MKLIKKLLFWTTFWSGILLIIALLISLLLPHIISTKDLKTKIVEQVSFRIGYKLKLHDVDILLFPRLHADIRNAAISVPGNFSVNINSVKAYPKIWPLLTGDINIYKLYIDSPNIKINIPEKLLNENDFQINTALRKVEKKLYDFIRSRTVEKTDIVVEISNGNVGLYNGRHLRFNFTSIFSHIILKPKHIKIALDAKSNITDSISIKSQYYPDNTKTKGNIRLNNLNPKLLFSYLYPDSDLKIDNSKADLRLYFSKKGVLNYYSNFEGEIPVLSFKRNNENLILKSRHLSGNININGERTSINIEKLILDNTGSIFSGKYIVHMPDSSVQLDLKGKDIDIKDTGKIALFLTGNSPTPQSIFNVLKEGKVPSINITAKVPNISELGNIKNISIKGKALNIKLSVPKPSLLIEDIKADVMVSGGILEAKNAEGRLGNSIAQNGTFKLSLLEDHHLLYLDALVHADLSPLPSILKQVVKNESFLNELYLIKQCEGKAEGKLTIDDKPGSYFLKVDVSKFDVKGVYNRFLNPISVSGNKFFLDNSVLKFTAAKAISGKTIVSNLSAGFSFDKDDSFKILSGKTTIDSKEVNQILLPFITYQNLGKQLNIKKGTVSLNNVELKGPLFIPAKWVLTTDGIMENMIVDCKSVFKEAINITNLKFSASQNNSYLYIKVIDANLRKTFIPDLSAEFGLVKNYPFKIKSKQALIDVKEINLFTPYFQLPKTAQEEINIQKGTAKLYSFDLKGPLLNTDKWRFATAGKIENMLVDYESVLKEPFNIATLDFSASRNLTAKGRFESKYNIEYGSISSGKSHATIKGDISLSQKESRVDISAFCKSLYWLDIKEMINQPAFKSCPAKKSLSPFVKGIIRAHIDSFIYDDYVLSPVNADILFGQKNISIVVSEANICGISLTGKIESCPTKVEFTINPFAKEQEIEPCLKCFWEGKHLATGTYNLKSNIYSKGEGKEVSKLLYGTLEFNAKKGRIYRLGFLSKIFALLNVTEIFRGKLPDLIGEGFAYNTMIIDGKLDKGNFVVSKFVIDGASMAIVCTGNMDISNDRADLIVLISPFKTFDLIIKYIPVLSQILDGNILSIPFRVVGKLEDPDVIPLSPTAVGTGLMNILQRTISLPVKIMQPVSPKKEVLLK